MSAQTAIQILRHDGHLLQFTNNSINSDSIVIGCYFDDLGFPQKITRKSLYGQMIIDFNNNIQGDLR